MQRVQTYSFDSVPLMSTFTLWTFAPNVRRVWRLEWLTLLPLALPLPQIAQVLDMIWNLTFLGIFVVHMNRGFRIKDHK